MIDGLKLQLTSEEYVAICLKRADYHDRKAERLNRRAKEMEPELDDEDEMAEDQQKYMSNRHDSPAVAMKRDAIRHLNRATVFRFRANHVIPNETYILSESDLSTLEVLKY